MSYLKGVMYLTLCSLIILLSSCVGYTRFMGYSEDTKVSGQTTEIVTEYGYEVTVEGTEAAKHGEDTIFALRRFSSFGNDYVCSRNELDNKEGCYKVLEYKEGWK